jgi:ferredoxin
MRVWVDQELCTGDGQCTEFSPDVFFMHDDGTYRSYVRNAGESGYGPDGEPSLRMAEGRADVPRSLEAAVSDAARYCPGACIFVEHVRSAGSSEPLTPQPATIGGLTDRTP